MIHRTLDISIQRLMFVCKGLVHKEEWMEGKLGNRRKRKRGKQSDGPLFYLKPGCWMLFVSTSVLVPTLNLFTIYIIFSFARIVNGTAYYLLLLW